MFRIDFRTLKVKTKLLCFYLQKFLPLLIIGQGTGDYILDFGETLTFDLPKPRALSNRLWRRSAVCDCFSSLFNYFVFRIALAKTS